MIENSTHLQGYINQMRSGDVTAQQLLMDHAYGRLQRLARKMVQGFPKVRRWEETDDVVQQACVRLWKCLKAVEIEDVKTYFTLAATQIRRELIDLARHYYGKQGLGKRHATERASAPARHEQAANSTNDPAALAQWTEFHEAINQLPEEQRTLFDLLHIHEIKLEEVAQLLDISVRTLSRRWRTARKAVYDTMQGNLP